MELDELRQMNAGDLRLKERQAREDIFRLKLKLRTNQLDNPSNYRRARKELARIMTLLRQKNGPAGAGAAARTKASDPPDGSASLSQLISPFSILRSQISGIRKPCVIASTKGGQRLTVSS